MVGLYPDRRGTHHYLLLIRLVQLNAELFWVDIVLLVVLGCAQAVEVRVLQRITRTHPLLRNIH